MWETDKTHFGTRDVKISAEANLDSFGRIRVGNPEPVFENKNIFNKNEVQWSEIATGVGASISHLPDEAAVSLAVGTADAEVTIRQTLRYFPYVPGKSQLIVMTGVVGTGKANVIKRLGYFDDNNGIFFEQSGTTLNVAVRSSVSGSPVDISVAQADWNLDKMDGTGPSEINIDISKAQIFTMDFQWLGVGRIRYGFFIGGKVVYCHEIKNSNTSTSVYMSTPTLPVRYEIRNSGVAASASTLKEICCSVTSEGGYTLPGLEFSAANGTATKSVTTRVPILAVRLLGSFNSKENRRSAKFVRGAFYSSGNDAFFEIAHVHKPSAITATWSPIGGGSGAEFSTDISAITGDPVHSLHPTFTPAGNGNRATADSEDLRFINLHSFISQDFDSTNSQVFVIYATSFSGVANVSSSLTWIESD